MTVRYTPLESKSGFKSPDFLVSPTGELSARRLNLSEDLSVQNITVGGVEILSGGDSTISLGDGIRYSYLEKVGTLQYLNIDGDFTVSQASTPYISIINGEIRINNPEYITEQLYENIFQNATGVVSTGSGSGASFNISRKDGTYSVEILTAGTDFSLGDTILIPGTFLGGERPDNDLTIQIISTIPGTLGADGILAVLPLGTAVSASAGSMNNIDVGISVPARGKFTSVVSTGNISVGGNAQLDGNLSVDGTVIATGAAQFASATLDTAPTEVYHATRKDYVDQRISAFSIAFGG